MSQIKSIKCTNCAAPLDLFGGGRVESITCSYCKSVLDLNDNYKVLSNFKSLRKLHKLPFEIGMKGKLQEVDYVIIGRITYEAVDYPHGEWTDFLLFSALYGYAYLTYEEGHLIYSKRNRSFPNLTWSQTRQSSPIHVEDKAYQPFDEYDAKVTYVEGELTWIAKRDDRTSFIDLTAPPFGISVEKSKNEIEYYQAQYLQADEVYEAFSIEKEEKTKTFHALEPFEQPFLKSLSLIAFWVLFIIALFGFAASLDGSGKLIKNISTSNKAVQQVDFTVSSKKYLVDIELQTSKAKELNNFNLQIHKNKKILFSLTPHAAYLFDQQTQKIVKKIHPWEKKSKKVRISLNLEALGTYHLSIKPIDPSLKSTLNISIKEASSRLNYFGWFFALTLFFWLLYKFYQWRHKRNLEEERGLYLEEDDSIISDIKSYITGENITHIIIFTFVILMAIYFED